MGGKNLISATQGLPNLTSGQKEKDVVAQCAAFPAQNCLNCVDSLSAETGAVGGERLQQHRADPGVPLMPELCLVGRSLGPQMEQECEPCKARQEILAVFGCGCSAGLSGVLRWPHVAPCEPQDPSAGPHRTGLGSVWVCTAGQPSPGTSWSDSCPGAAWQQQPLALQPVFPSEPEGFQSAGIYPVLGCSARATRRGTSQCCARRGSV